MVPGRGVEGERRQTDWAGNPVTLLLTVHPDRPSLILHTWLHHIIASPYLSTLHPTHRTQHPRSPSSLTTAYHAPSLAPP